MARHSIGVAKAVLGWTPAYLTFTDVLFSTAAIDGSSMQPTLRSSPNHGTTRVLTDKLSIHLYKFRRGDVVTLRSPSDPNQLLVKRLIGLEGDWLTLPGSTSIQKIPQGACWVEGDNLEHSKDSFSSFGPVRPSFEHLKVPLALIEARVLCTIWPPAQVGNVASNLPPGRVLRRNADAIHGTDH